MSYLLLTLRGILKGYTNGYEFKMDETNRISRFYGSIGVLQTPQAPMNANYATMKITVSDKKFSTSYSATIRGRQDIDIYPQVSGTIERLCVTEGEKVRKGQILFVIDQVPYKAALNTLHVLQWRLPNSPTTAIKSYMPRK